MLYFFSHYPFERSTLFREVQFDTSTYREEPKFLFSTLKGKIDQFDFFPDYLKILIPTIWKQSSQI